MITKCMNLVTIYNPYPSHEVNQEYWELIPNAEPPRPMWMLTLFGKDFFHRVVIIDLAEAQVY